MFRIHQATGLVKIGEFVFIHFSVILYYYDVVLGIHTHAPFQLLITVIN